MKRTELLVALIAAAGLSTAAGAATLTSDHPDSSYAAGSVSQMIQLAANQQGKGADGNQGQGIGGGGPGNPGEGNDKDVGNAGYSG